jgi:predicted amidohydrolase
MQRGLQNSGNRYSTLLVFPDGTTYRHDKDFPSFWETCYSEAGNDDGVLETPLGPVGVALCWEMVRSGTAKRLLGEIEEYVPLYLR